MNEYIVDLCYILVESTNEMQSKIILKETNCMYTEHYICFYFSLFCKWDNVV